MEIVKIWPQFGNVDDKDDEDSDSTSVFRPRVQHAVMFWKRVLGLVGRGWSAEGRRRYARVSDVKIEVVRMEKFLEKERVERNVFHQPLRLHSTSPPTGFTRSGYCESPASDLGNHSVAAILTTTFLTFTSTRGNNLSSIGLKPGCKWCLCVSRWKEAFDEALKTGNDDIVPRVYLHRTNERALEEVRLEDLEKFAVDVEPESVKGKVGDEKK